MFEESSERSTPLRLLAIGGAGFLLSIGLCGAGALSPKAGFLVGAGVIVLAISILLFLAGLIGLLFNW